MKLVTSCPACNTSFHVKPEQLSAFRGDVRCGKCNYLFNALDRLSEVPEIPAAEVPKALEASEQQDFSIPAPPVEDVAVPVSAPIAEKPEAAALKVSDFNTTPASAKTKSPKFSPSASSKTKLKRTAKRNSPKWPLIFLAVLLLLLAMAQTVYYLRTPIAAKWPALKPHLVKACDLLGCKIELPSNPDLLAIDDSDLQEDAERQGLIRLSSTLINRAPYAQAYPLLELTLTDTDDKPLLRRTFTPSEYLPADSKISNGIAAGEEIHIKLALTAGDVPVAGYRVFVTFP